ncbi:retrovirus-related pol polyprotein from transposon TNT 1-94 [Tanacetum coccineum]
MYDSSKSNGNYHAYIDNINQQSEFSQPETGLIVPVFQKGDDPIDVINHMMSFLTAVVTSRYPTTNNQLRNSSNPRQQATINNGRVTLQPIQGRQTSFSTGTSRTYTPGASGSNSGKQRTITCYNCKGEGHMSKQCTKPKRKRDDSWFKEKVLLVEAQAHGQILNEEELAFLADPGIPEDALAEVHNHDNMNNNVVNQVVQVMPSSQQSNVVNHSETEITSDSNIIPYSQYVIESQQATKEESRNIDREIALEKQIKHLDNIVFKRDQSAQTVHMLTKPQFFYDNTTKQALGFQNPFYLQKAQQSKPKLYVGDIIVQTNLILLSQNSVNSSEPTLSIRPTNVEVPKELPKVSMVNTSLKKLKHHLANFDVVFLRKDHAHLAITEALKDLFSTFNQHLVDELSEVQNVFYQMEQAVEQHRIESKTFEVKMNQVLNENERLLEQVMSKDIVNLIANSSVDNDSVNVRECQKCLKLETELQTDFVEKQIYDKLFKSFTILEKHCISLEVDTQLKQEIFQRENSVSNQSVPSFDQLFELNELKAQSQEKDTTYKQLYDSIKPTRIRSKEQCDDLINQVNIKSVEISDLNASLQEKALAITALKDELRKLKGKALVDNDVSNHPSDPEMHQVNMEPITPKLLNKRSAHSAYIKHTQEEVAVLRDLVDHIKAHYPLDSALESACKYTKLIQELLSKISKTCPSINNSGEQLVTVTPKNKDKRVRFTEPSTSASGSQPSGNTKKDKIQQTPSSTLKNKVEAHPRKVKSSLKNKDCVVAPKGTAHVQHSKLNANYELKCVKCNGCMLSDNHDLCVLDFINNVNARAKSRSVKKNSKRKVWKPTGKVFTNIGYIWRPTGRTFTIVGNACPLTRITTTTEVPLRKPITLDNDTPKPTATLVYSRKPRKSKTNVPVSNPKILQSISANKKEPSKSWGSINFNVPSSSLYVCRSFKLSSGLKTAGYKVTTAGSRLLLLVKKLMIRNYQEESFTHKEEMAPMATSDPEHKKDGIDFKIEKFDKASKDLDQLLESQITDKSKKGLGYSAVPPPHPLIYNRPNKLDLSYSGLEEFQQPEFEVYGLRANKSVCENSSNETKIFFDAPFIKEWVSDNEDEVESPVVVEKKTVVPTIPKVDVVRPKQQEKPVRKTVRYAEMYRSKGPRGNQRNWNNLKSQQLGSDFVMNNKACFVCGSFDHLKKDCGKRIIKPVWKNTRRVNDHYSTRMTHSNPRRNMIPQAVLMRSRIKAVNTAKPKDAHNVVKRNRFNTIKASACWVWMPKNRVIDHVSKNNNASVTLKRFDYIDAQGRFKWMHRLRGGRSAAKIKDNDERQRISRAEGLIQELLQKIFIQAERSRR